MGLNGVFDGGGGMCKCMNIAKVLGNGMVTIPIEIRRMLGVEQGDRVLFFRSPDGEIVVRNAEVLLHDNPSSPRSKVEIAKSLFGILPAETDPEAEKTERFEA